MRLFAVSFCVNFIDFLADFVLKETGFSKDLSKTCVVFPTKRAQLFLNRVLSQKINSSFFGPRVFSISEFIDYLANKTHPHLKILSVPECAWVIFNILNEFDFSGFTSYKDAEFCEFFLWAKKIYEFLEELDKEDIDDSKLENIEKNAEIGYEVPQKVNILLKNLIKIRGKFKEFLKQNNFATPGYKYQLALKASKETDLGEFNRIYFAGFFALRNVEKKILKNILARKQGALIVHKTGKWKVFEELEEFFKVKFSELKYNQKTNKTPQIEIFECFDTHSQIKKAKEILEQIQSPQETCIMLPDPSSLIPLLSQGICYFNFEYNVSMGYPLRRTYLFSFLDSLIKTQERKRGAFYYTKDYLKIITHPFIKNLNLGEFSSQLATLIEEIENSILGEIKKPYSQKSFISLKEIEEDNSLFKGDQKLKDFLKNLHYIFFDKFSEIKTPSRFATHLEEIFLFILKHSKTGMYIFSGEIFKRFFESLAEIKHSLFKEEEFKDIYSLFEFLRFNLLFETIPFSGSPLKGLQILGALETRTLNFKNIIILDVNEGIIPQDRDYESLIPEVVRYQLGLISFKDRDEIYRYHFKRFIEGAEKVFLLYKNLPQEKLFRSRFIEEIIWEKEKQASKLGVVNVEKVTFNIEILKKELSIEKDEKILKKIENLALSASSLDMYLECPLKFYFYYILKLKEPQSLEEMEPKTVGIFFHEVLRCTYVQFLNRQIILDKEFQEYFFRVAREKFKEYFKFERGESILLREVVFYRLKKFLENEKKKQSRLIYLEKEFPIKKNYIISLNGKKVFLKGILDRVEEREMEDGKVLLIIDYKTSSPENFKFKIDRINIENVETIRENIHSLQLPLYLLLVRKDFPDANLDAGFYFLKNTQEKFLFKDYLKCKNIEEKKKLLNFFEKIVKTLIRDLLNPEVPFRKPTVERGNCKFCSYSVLCKK